MLKTTNSQSPIKHDEKRKKLTHRKEPPEDLQTRIDTAAENISEASIKTYPTNSFGFMSIFD